MAIETLRPSATGDVEALEYAVGDGAGTHYVTVDEASADEDTTYVEQEQLGSNYDLYNLQDSGVGTGIISSVTVFIRCRSGLTLNAWAKVVIKTEATEYRGTQEVMPADATYRDYSKQWATNPNIGSAWTWTQVNALQAGVELYSDNNLSSRYARCTQVYIEVDYAPAVAAVRGSPLAALIDAGII